MISRYRTIRKSSLDLAATADTRACACTPTVHVTSKTTSVDANVLSSLTPLVTKMNLGLDYHIRQSTVVDHGLTATVPYCTSL